MNIDDSTIYVHSWDGLYALSPQGFSGLDALRQQKTPAGAMLHDQRLADARYELGQWMREMTNKIIKKARGE